MNKQWIAALLLGGALISSCTKKTEETRPIRKDVTETVFASGFLEAEGAYNLTAQTEGYLLEVNFREGDLVREGQVLAVIDNQQNVVNTGSARALYEIARRNTLATAPSLVQARNNAEIARQKMEQDSTEEQRFHKLLKSNSIALAEYESAALRYKNARLSYASALETYRQLKQEADQQLVVQEAQKEVNQLLVGQNQIRAVFAGKVYEKFKQRGDFVRKGDVIARIGDADIIYARVSIDEGNIRRIQTGQEAVIRLNIDQEKTYQGQVGEILPAFDESTQSFTCKLFFSDSLDFRLIHTQLQANIIVGLSRNALLIPRNYLQYGNLVLVKDQEKPVPVKTRFVSSEWVQIESGIDEKTILVTDNLK